VAKLIDQDAWNGSGDAAAPLAIPMYTRPLRPEILAIGTTSLVRCAEDAHTADPRADRAGHEWGVEMHAVIGWWISLWHHGLIGPLIACIAAAFVVLAAGNAVIWPIAWIKAAIVGRSGAEHPHQELRVVDERPVDHR
jgi:hypothetical protein